MEQEILQQLRRTEQEQGIRVLFAAEAGSRAWGFSAPQDAYDVRFVYVRPRREYLRLDDTPDSLCISCGNAGITGWDLRRALQRIYDGHPSLSQWCESPLLYEAGAAFPQLRKACRAYFSPAATARYYSRSAQKACALPLEPGTYLYALRAVLCCRWAVERCEPPPVELRQLMRCQTDASLWRIVDYLLQCRADPLPDTSFSFIPQLDDYLSGSLADLQPCLETLHEPSRPGWEPLNELFLSIVSGC